ncbi:hypothetical protein Nepgr_006050 [Nepenthes gracilis]|uniref:Uncharacterized protein n=1 Tax=Nepenthes gracilis TaxID=150966 RepID=A0AAD3S4I1_NEPGR|nr:hypothetical protein Nepgr_006050 [Nepenthes gracilis]
MIGLLSDRALVKDDDIHLTSGIAMSSLTTSSTPSPWVFTRARRSSGRKIYIECVLLDELPLMRRLGSLPVIFVISLCLTSPSISLCTGVFGLYLSDSS